MNIKELNIKKSANNKKIVSTKNYTSGSHSNRSCGRIVPFFSKATNSEKEAYQKMLSFSKK